MRWRTFLPHFAGALWRGRRLRGEALRDFQDRRARAIVRFAVARAPFYRQHFAGQSLHDWPTLPTTDKAWMMANFDGFNTLGIRGTEAMAVALRAEATRDFVPTLHGVTVGISSGTSGHRGLFLVSPDEQAAWAGFLLARLLPSFRLRGFSLAFFLRSNSNLYESLGGRWLRFRYHDVMTPLETSIATLNRDRPDIVVAPPALLVLLAEALQAGTLRIRPERLISVADVLEPQDRDYLAGAFACPVQQIYQCTEGLLALSCPHGSLHLQEDLVAVQLEPLGEERYTPIVTDLWRRTQPIIRYRLNDVVRVDSRPCPCGSGFRVLAQVEGRCDDIVYFHARDGALRRFFPDTVRRMILLASLHILDYRAEQTRPGQLRVHLQASAEVDFSEVVAGVRESVARTLAEYDCQPCDLAIESGVPTLAAGEKRRRVRRVGDGCEFS